MFDVFLRYDSSLLVEINAHSLFSKWFSESGKLVMKLFEQVRRPQPDPMNRLISWVTGVRSSRRWEYISARVSRRGGIHIHVSIQQSRRARRRGASRERRLDVFGRFEEEKECLSLEHIESCRYDWFGKSLRTTNHCLIMFLASKAFRDRLDMQIFLGPPNLVARYTTVCSDAFCYCFMWWNGADMRSFDLVSRSSWIAALSSRKGSFRAIKTIIPAWSLRMGCMPVISRSTSRCRAIAWQAKASRMSLPRPNRRFRRMPTKPTPWKRFYTLSQSCQRYEWIHILIYQIPSPGYRLAGIQRPKAEKAAPASPRHVHQEIEGMMMAQEYGISRY